MAHSIQVPGPHRPGYRLAGLPVSCHQLKADACTIYKDHRYPFFSFGIFHAWASQYHVTLIFHLLTSKVRCYLRYNSVYLTCSKKPMGSQLSLQHGTNKKLKCETKNKTMSMIGPVHSHCHEGSPVGERSLRWEGFVKKVGFEPGVKERRSDG